MIVSHSHRYCFVKTRKVGGTSVQCQLNEDGLIDQAQGDVVFGRPFTDSKRRSHLPAQAVRKIAGEKNWRDYFTFSIERNPWDMWVSFYWFGKTKGRPQTQRGFKHFLKAMTKDRRVHNFRLYTEVDDRGERKPCVDLVIRYEELDQGLEQVYQQIGAPWGGLNFVERSHNRKDPRVQAYYDDETDQIIRDVFAWPISYFGYECPEH